MPVILALRVGVGMEDAEAGGLPWDSRPFRLHKKYLASQE